MVFPNPSDQDLIIKALNPAYIIEEISIINLAGKTIIEYNYSDKRQHDEFRIIGPTILSLEYNW